tara:strand:- start:9 stop:194 length:186 start_codon:yes stop_codon:yes gene_type:complete
MMHLVLQVLVDMVEVVMEPKVVMLNLEQTTQVVEVVELDHHQQEVVLVVPASFSSHIPPNK